MNNSPSNTGLKFSVIIPMYNAEKTISRALQSVLNQSYTSYEIIVVDDASTDSSCDIITKYKIDNVQLIKKQTNTGSSDTRNIGMNIAKGHYIAFLDADDIWHKDKLTLVNDAIISIPGLYLFFHPFTQEDINHNPLPGKLEISRYPFVKLLPSNKIATSCAIIRNDTSFRFEQSMRYTEDFDLWLRIGYKYNIYYTNTPLTQIFRPFLSKGGISANKWEMRKGEMKAYTRLVKLNPLFVLALPMLYILSLGKHLFKALRG